MNQYETMYLSGLRLPLYGELKEKPDANISKKETLDASLRVDYFNQRRSWQISWDLLSISDYQDIRDKYDQQFENSEFLNFIIEDKGINVSVLVTISDVDLKHNAQWVKGFTITLEEQYAVS